MDIMEMKYIGVISLLGRLAIKLTDPNDRYEIEAALEDFSKNTEPGKRFIIHRDSRGGFSLEPRP